MATVLDTDKARSTRPTSHYRRLTRFFDAVAYSGGSRLRRRLQEMILRLTLHFISALPDARRRRIRYLLLDGTKWEQPQESVHLLTLAILIGGIALPIGWVDLAKIGHSSQSERIQLFDRLCELFDLKNMTLLADREYVGKRWFRALRQDYGLHFIIRCKRHIYQQELQAVGGKNQQQLEAKLRRCKRQEQVSKAFHLAGQRLYYLIRRNPKATHPKEDEFVYLLTSRADRAWAGKDYVLRWPIEVTFGHLKTNGFDLEAMRLQGKAKHEVMLAILNLVFAMTIYEGVQLFRKQPQADYQMTNPQSGRRTRRHSLFRTGYSLLISRLINLKAMCRYIYPFWKKTIRLDWAFV